MNPTPLDRETILRRIDGIHGELAELRKLVLIPPPEFAEGIGFKLSQFHLHRALEGVFHIGSHILSRIPGAQASGYKDVAVKLGEHKIVPKPFAEGPLKNMAGYRNRLVHFYAEITPDEIRKIITSHLADVEAFLKAAKEVLSNPERFGIAKDQRAN